MIFKPNKKIEFLNDIKKINIQIDFSFISIFGEDNKSSTSWELFFSTAINSGVFSFKCANEIV